MEELFAKWMAELWVRVTLYTLALLAILFLLWWVFVKPGMDAERLAIEKARAAYSAGQVQSADTARAVANETQKVGQQIQSRVEQGKEVIDAIPESKSGLDGRLHCASLRQQCLSPSYRDSAQCRRVQQTCP